MGAQELTRRLGGDWHRHYGLVPAPGHSPKDRSAKVIDGENGDIIVQPFAKEDWKQIKDAWRAQGLLPDTAGRTRHPPPQRPKRRPLRPVDFSLWEMAQPITAEDVAGRYLKNRWCALPPPGGDLRFCPSVYHWPSKRRWPAMIGRITDTRTGTPIGLHQTFLAPDGRGKAPVGANARLYPKGHQKKGGVIRLWPDEEAMTGLCIGEGIETCLTAARGFTPVWAALDAGNLSAFPVLDGIESLTILADDDVAGISAAKSCSDRWIAAGREVRVWKRGNGR